MTLALDFSNMMAGTLPNGAGITAQEWAEAGEAFRAAHRQVMAMQEQLGFLGLPTDDGLLRASVEVADNGRGRFDDVLLLGIGGSALGPVALRTALCAPHWNALTAAQRNGYPRLHVLDNVDPATIAATLERKTKTVKKVMRENKSANNQ